MMHCTNNADKQSTVSGVASVDPGGAPSRVSPGFLPVHVLAGVGP